MLTIQDFSAKHLQKARQIALENYEAERRQVPCLPATDPLPPLDDFIDNGLGVAAFEGDEMVGFLCCHNPRANFFGTASGVFSPIHGHGARGEKRDRIYSQLYQAAAEKWVSRSIFSHAIALYSHDREAIFGFFSNGFGSRCVDAIRAIAADGHMATRPEGFTFRELFGDERLKTLDLNNLMLAHFRQSPTFMPTSGISAVDLTVQLQQRLSRHFAAERDGRIIAYLEVTEEGENFVCDHPQMLNICGAFAHPDYRGSGLMPALLAFLVEQLDNEGYTLLGVDCESINPAAVNFWLKHFMPYTYTLTRRIDERIIRHLIG